MEELYTKIKKPNKFSKAISVGIIILSLLTLFILAPSLVSMKNTFMVFIGFALTALSAVGIYYSVSSFIKRA